MAFEAVVGVGAVAGVLFYFVLHNVIVMKNTAFCIVVAAGVADATVAVADEVHGAIAAAASCSSKSSNNFHATRQQLGSSSTRHQLLIRRYHIKHVSPDPSIIIMFLQTRALAGFYDQGLV